MAVGLGHELDAVVRERGNDPIPHHVADVTMAPSFGGV
jgi:hypothetical protein